MKITCTKENLNKSLELVSHLASKNTNLPILNNVLIRAKEGILELIGTDLEVGIKSQFRGKIEQEGEFTLLIRMWRYHASPKATIESVPDKAQPVR